jgi:LuxR family maltose regulon positive regulatory protein
MLEVKTDLPTLRSGLVTRTELLARLESTSAPVVALVAPSGYGKTTLLTQFAARIDRPLAWLNLDEGDGDPKELISQLSHTLARAGLIPAEPQVRNMESSSVLTRGVDLLFESIDADAKGLLILDQLDQLPTRSSLDVIGAVMTKARGRLSLMVATRSSIGLPFGSLRAKGDLLELTSGDLALNRPEAEEVFAITGVPEIEGMDAVLQRTEYWPVAVYLAALAIMSGRAASSTLEIRGDDIYLADYIRQELMKDVPSELESFLLRSSILPRMSGDLCDYVLDTEHSAKTLDQLQQSNLLVISLDRTRSWYRYHSLLRDFLQAELHKRGAGEEAKLHSRASTWFEDEGFKELALEHARLAGDDNRVADLLARYSRSFYATGRHETLSRWFTWLEGSEVRRSHTELAALGVLVRALAGDFGGAERLALFAYDDPDDQPREESELGPLGLMVRSYLAPRGVDQALTDADAAHEILRHDGEWAHISFGALAMATVAVSGVAAAETLWADAQWRGESIGGWPLEAVARAMRATAAIRQDDWDVATTVVGDTIGRLYEYGLHADITSCLAFVEAARISVHGGDLEKGRSHMTAASTIMPRLTAAFPVYSVLTLHEKARAYIELADIAGARQVMRAASDILALRPRLGTLVAEH